MSILEKVNTVGDIKKLNIKELETLTEELRQEIISAVKKNGGHLSSNLGIVETTVALYYVFDFPKDKLIFDVGHQCYAHKILSGRKNEFSSIRTEGGLSGFPNTEESDFDLFTTGHAGSSLSSALGLCTARDKKGEDFFVIDIVGDGSIVNGLNLEAISASAEKPRKFLLVLNDNGMSISKNGNGFYKFISKGTTKKGYVKSKNFIKRIFGNSFFTRFLRRIRDFIKRSLNKNDYFEHFGFKYVGVIDGNNIKELVKIMTRIKNSSGKSTILHISTVKGKGYTFAEERADAFHGVGKDFKIKEYVYSHALGETLSEIMQKDASVCAITAGMKDGTGLKPVSEKYPDRFFDVGIAEEYAVTFASGLSKGGLKPVVAVYSTFLQRAYDQILHDVCIQNLPVVFCLDRAGLVGFDGQTHQGVFDISYLSHIPNIKILAPSTVKDFKECLYYAIKLSCPVAIRYPNDCESEKREVVPISKSLWEKTADGNKITILAVGPRLVNIANAVSKEFDGKVAVYSARSVKPLDEKVLENITTPVITMEENGLIGGFGTMVLNYFAKNGKTNKVTTLGIKDEFVKHASVNKQLEENGLSERHLTDLINKILKEI